MPTLAGYTFTPPAATDMRVSADAPNQNYVGAKSSPVPHPKVSQIRRCGRKVGARTDSWAARLGFRPKSRGAPWDPHLH
jgi:hypothetical protein